MKYKFEALLIIVTIGLLLSVSYTAYQTQLVQTAKRELATCREEASLKNTMSRRIIEMQAETITVYRGAMDSTTKWMTCLVAVTGSHECFDEAMAKFPKVTDAIGRRKDAE